MKWNVKNAKQHSCLYLGIHILQEQKLYIFMQWKSTKSSRRECEYPKRVI